MLVGVSHEEIMTLRQKVLIFFRSHFPFLPLSVAVMSIRVLL